MIERNVHAAILNLNNILKEYADFPFFLEYARLVVYKARMEIKGDMGGDAANGAPGASPADGNQGAEDNIIPLFSLRDKRTPGSPPPENIWSEAAVNQLSQLVFQKLDELKDEISQNPDLLMTLARSLISMGDGRRRMG